MAWILLVIARQPPLFHQPAKTSLDDPAPGQHDEALLIFEPLDDGKSKTCPLPKARSHGAHEGFEFSCVTAIRENDQQAQKLVAEHAQENFGTITVLHAGRCHNHAQQQAVGVCQRVAFASFDLFARVVAAAGCRELAALDALAVDDPCAGRGVFFNPARTWLRRTSLMRGSTPWRVHWASASCTVLLGGNSLGSSAH